MAEDRRFPLVWPPNLPRTPLALRRHHPNFRVTEVVARDEMLEACRLLGGERWVISSNVELRADGLPRAARRPPDDLGVALYFDHGGRGRCIACDHWLSLRDNYRAIWQCLEGMRAIGRSGCPDMVEAALEGFLALPSMALQRHWTTVLGLELDASREAIEQAYRRLAKLRHPDSPTGSKESMVELNTAREQALEQERSRRDVF